MIPPSPMPECTTSERPPMAKSVSQKSDMDLWEFVRRQSFGPHGNELAGGWRVAPCAV